MLSGKSNSQEGLEWNGLQQVAVYGDDSNLFSKNINTKKNKAKVLLQTRKEIYLNIKMTCRKPVSVLMSLYYIS
jgi:hypothetical protein